MIRSLWMRAMNRYISCCNRCNHATFACIIHVDYIVAVCPPLKVIHIASCSVYQSCRNRLAGICWRHLYNAFCNSNIAVFLRFWFTDYKNSSIHTACLRVRNHNLGNSSTKSFYLCTFITRIKTCDTGILTMPGKVCIVAFISADQIGCKCRCRISYSQSYNVLACNIGICCSKNRINTVSDNFKRIIAIVICNGNFCGSLRNTVEYSCVSTFYDLYNRRI